MQLLLLLPQLVARGQHLIIMGRLFWLPLYIANIVAVCVGGGGGRGGTVAARAGNEARRGEDAIVVGRPGMRRTIISRGRATVDGQQRWSKA